MLDFNLDEKYVFKCNGKEVSIDYPSNIQLGEYQKKFKSLNGDESEMGKLVAEFLVNLGMEKDLAYKLKPKHTAPLLNELIKGGDEGNE
jgi:hypothetical protein